MKSDSKAIIPTYFHVILAVLKKFEFIGKCYQRILFFYIGKKAHLIKILFLFADIPEATIHLGTSLAAENIREGTDVYFDCRVHARPIAYKVEWRHNVSILDSFK